MGDLPTQKAPEGIPQEIPCPECDRMMDFMGIDYGNESFHGKGKHHWYRHKGTPHHNIRLPLSFLDERWMPTCRGECARVYETRWDCIARPGGARRKHLA